MLEPKKPIRVAIDKEMFELIKEYQIKVESILGYRLMHGSITASQLLAYVLRLNRMLRPSDTKHLIVTASKRPYVRHAKKIDIVFSIPLLQ